jgi:hypothetical protein
MSSFSVAGRAHLSGQFGYRNRYAPSSLWNTIVSSRLFLSPYHYKFGYFLDVLEPINMYALLTRRVRVI